MAARNASRSSGRGGGAAAWIAVLSLLALGGAGAWIYLANGGSWDRARESVTDRLHALLASGDEGEIAASPQPRGAGPSETAPSDTAAKPLTEMPPLVSTGSGGAGEPAIWPALSAADLLAQAAAAPDRALKETAFDLPAWRRFARPFAAPKDRPLVAILIGGLGNDGALTAAAIAGLPADVSLSFSPYAPDLAQWIAAARAFGHEAMVDLPLQTKDGRDPGPLGLLVALNANEAARRMTAIADAAPGVLGFAGDGGDALLLDDGAAGRVLAGAAGRGLAFIDMSGEPMSLAAAAAGDTGAAFAHAAVVVDDSTSPAAVAERLAVAADLALRGGSALLAAKAQPEAITAIADWARRQGDGGSVLAPASALLQSH